MRRNAQLTVQEKYMVARKNLLLMLILTVVNIVLFVAGANTMLLFSATVPYYGVIYALVLGNPIIFLLGIGIAVISLLLYLLCWIFSKKHYGWMVTALVLFVFDTVVMVVLYILMSDVSGILDVLIHAWVLYYLFMGTRCGIQMKNMPEPVLEQTELTQETYVDMQSYEDDSYLRRADVDVKHRVFVETDALGHCICFQRVKRTNELVIDGYVYAEVEMLIETAHELETRIDGHEIKVGFDGIAHSYISIDGTKIAKKIRLY